MRISIALAALALTAAASPAALACEGTVVLLEDHFAKSSPVWSTTGAFKYVDGKLETKTKPGYAEKIFANPIYQDVDICADVSVIAGSNLPSIYAGLAFWATDTDNLYTFQITPGGQAGVYRLNDGKWETVLDDKEVDSIRKGRDAVNTLRVVTVGGKATLYVNGDEVGDVSGDLPSPGQHIGFVVQASSQSSATFRMDDVTVTAPEETATDDTGDDIEDMDDADSPDDTGAPADDDKTDDAGSPNDSGSPGDTGSPAGPDSSGSTGGSGDSGSSNGSTGQ